MSEQVELRGDIDREIIDVLDAVAKARRLSRTQVWAEILKHWADEKVHESTLVLRLAKSHGTKGEA